MNRSTRKVAGIFALILLAAYFLMLVPARTGYGYSGHSSRVFWFSGGNSTIYHSPSPSTRSGSTQGPKTASKGYRGGK